VEATEGAIGFAVQKALLDAAVPLVPEGAEVCLRADRFYGTADLIAWCQDRNWDDRLRLKGNRVVRDTEGRTTTGPLAKERLFALENVQLTARKATTPIGVIHDPDHAEPWIIAMAATPGYLKTLDYSARWAIEPMFSDFTSRGFGVEDTRSSTRTGSPGSCWLWPWRSTRPFQRGRGTPRPLRHPPKKRWEASAEKSRSFENLLLHQRTAPDRPTDFQRSAPAAALVKPN
jgi:hypothetical protein